MSGLEARYVPFLSRVGYVVLLDDADSVNGIDD